MERIRKTIPILGISILCGWLGLPLFAQSPKQMRIPRLRPFTHDIRPGSGVSSVRWLSRYNPKLRNTPGDTQVYCLNGKEPGGTVVVVAGTHGSEVAGVVAAMVLVEHARVEKGRLIVVPHANNSAITYTDPKRPGPEFVFLETPSGTRRVKYGSRLTAKEHQGCPDPGKYHHPRSAELLDGFEARNLDRSYPGRADGTLTERIAYGIMELLRQEKADVAFDLHEAGPESRMAWMVVANPKNLETAAMAVVNLDTAGISMTLEPSSDSFRGLSHREWGDATSALAFLFETPNPAMRNPGAMADPVNDVHIPLTKRVGVHLSTMLAILQVFNDQAGESKRVQFLDVPDWPKISGSGLKPYLK